MATPRISFRPNHPFNKDKSLKTTPCPILVEVYSKSLRTELSTGLKVYPANFVDGRATSKEKDYRTINTELARIETAIMDVIENSKPADDLKALVRSAVRGEDPKASIDQKKTVETWIESFIKEAKVKDSTKQVYRATLKHLKDYAGPRSIRLEWDIFGLAFYMEFTAYLYSIGHCDNTVGKTIKTLKTFLSEAFERDLHTNLSFKKKGFKVIQTQVDEIYLTEKEINSFDKAEVEPEFVPAQKLFVFACDVGLRYSDYARLGPNNLVTTLDGFRLDVTTQKTGEDVKIALTERAKRIWDSWNGLPPKIANQVFNRQIKEIAEKAGITEQVQSRNTIKGVVKLEWLPKCKMVTAHTARRSFATNAYSAGMPVKTIMSITGHTTEKAFNKYIRFSKAEHASIMQEFLRRKESGVPVNLSVQR